MFAEDIWLSKVLGVSSFNMVRPSLKVSKYDLDYKDFVYVKLATDDFNLINHLLNLNFTIIENNIILKTTKINLFDNNDIECRFAIKDDENELREIAAQSLQTSRFHIDYKISNQKANYLKSEWVGSFFKAQRGDWMIVAKYGNQICGFLQLLKENDNLIIDLIAVKKEFQRMGVGKSLIGFAYKKCATKSTSLIVGTQLNNLKSIHFYHKIGFQITDSKYTLHYHK